MINFVMLVSRQGEYQSATAARSCMPRAPLVLFADTLCSGKVRLAKWFQTLPSKNKAKIVKDVTQLVLARRTRMCNFLEYKGESGVGGAVGGAVEREGDLPGPPRLGRVISCSYVGLLQLVSAASPTSPMLGLVLPLQGRLSLC